MRLQHYKGKEVSKAICKTLLIFEYLRGGNFHCKSILDVVICME